MSKHHLGFAPAGPRKESASRSVGQYLYATCRSVPFRGQGAAPPTWCVHGCWRDGKGLRSVPVFCCALPAALVAGSMLSRSPGQQRTRYHWCVLEPRVWWSGRTRRSWAPMLPWSTRIGPLKQNETR